MKHTNKILLFLISILIFSNCKKDDDTGTPQPLTPVAAFSVDKTNAEVGATINFTNNSQNASTYSWNFGDGSTGTDTDPTYSYSAEGTYTVTLTATGAGGTDTATETITVSTPDPIADFTVDKMTAGAGEIITFTNNSQNADTYLWDFGDGDSSSEDSPEHSYGIDGTYTVSLTAKGNGKENTTTKTILIETNYDGDWKGTATETSTQLNSATILFSVNGNSVSISSFNASTNIGLLFGSNWSADLAPDNSFSLAPYPFLVYSITLETSSSGTGILTFDGEDYAMEVTRQ